MGRGASIETCNCELTSSNRALMMVFQCLMVVIESGWQMLRIASPILAALFKATRFSSSFFMNSFKKARRERVSIGKHEALVIKSF